jgi:hypothetical protein
VQLILAPESIHTSRGIHEPLLAGIERVTGGAYVDMDVFTHRRARGEAIATTAGDGYLAVCRMYFGFHDSINIKKNYAILATKV